MEKPRRLSPKHWAFVQNFVDTGNRIESARKAGYIGEKYQLSITAAQTLKREDVQEAIKEYTEWCQTKGKAIVAASVEAPKTPRELSPAMAKFATRDDRLAWLASVVAAQLDDPDDVPPWTVRMQAFKMMGEMNGDFLVRNQPAEAKTQYTQIIISEQDARDVLSGAKTIQEVTSGEATGGDDGDRGRSGGGDHGGIPDGDVIDGFLADGSDPLQGGHPDE